MRGQLLFKPSETLQLRLIADYASFDSECCAQVYVRVAPMLKAAARQYAALAANVPGGSYVPPSLNPYDRVTDIDAPLSVDTSEGGVSGIADWTLGGATLTSVSAWRFWNGGGERWRLHRIPIQLTQHIPSRQDQYREELRIDADADGDQRLSYVGGLYFFRQKITGRSISIYGPLATYWLLGAPSAALPGNLLDGYGTDGHTDFRSCDALIGLPEKTPDALLADKGYDPDTIRTDLSERNIKAVILGRSIRYDQLANSFLGMVHLATARYWLRFVHVA